MTRIFKLFKSSAWKQLTYCSPNMNELRMFRGLLEGKTELIDKGEVFGLLANSHLSLCNRAVASSLLASSSLSGTVYVSNSSCNFDRIMYIVSFPP